MAKVDHQKWDEWLLRELAARMDKDSWDVMAIGRKQIACELLSHQQKMGSDLGWIALDSYSWDGGTDDGLQRMAPAFLKCILDHDSGPYESTRASLGGDMGGFRNSTNVTLQGGTACTISPQLCQVATLLPPDQLLEWSKRLDGLGLPTRLQLPLVVHCGIGESPHHRCKPIVVVKGPKLVRHKDKEEDELLPHLQASFGYWAPSLGACDQM